MSDVLNLSDLNVLSALFEAISKGRRVKWLDDRDHLQEGTLRHFVKDPESAVFLSDEDDVRDAYVRITTRVEHFLKVRDVAKKMNELTFVVIS